MANLETSPVWKKVYMIISSKSSNVAVEVVNEVLKLYKDDLVKNLLEYKPYTRNSFKTWKEESGVTDLVVDDEMANFVHVLSKDNDLDVNVTWTVVCNFLMFEYYGKVDELKSIIRYDTNGKLFIDAVWHFYSAERMFLLKTLRHIFESTNNKAMAFHERFQAFIKSADLDLLWKNCLNVFENLITEIDKDKSILVSSDTLTRWIHRNNREQVEVVILLNYILQHKTINGDELESVLTLFLKHGFGRHPLYQESMKISRQRDLLEVKYAEVGLCLSIMDKYWYQLEICKPLSNNLVKSLEIQLDNNIVLFAWAVLQTSIENTDSAMDYCNMITLNLIEKDIFSFLRQLIIYTMFSKSYVGEIVTEAAFTVMCEFLKICADFSFLHEQVQLCYLTADLLRRKGMVVLDHLGPIFQLSMDAFPFDFNPFLEMCKSMMSLPGNFQTVMKLLHNIPSFLAEIPWNNHRDQFQLKQPQKLFNNSNLFVIPAGTTVVRFNYKGSDYTKFLYPFDFFALMEVFAKELTRITLDSYHKNLIQLVEIGYNFIVHILKHYEEDLRANNQLRNLIQKLNILPTQFCLGPVENFSFVKLYFEINCVLITRNLLSFSEAFPPMIKKKVFPQIKSFDINKQLLSFRLHDGSILFKYLREEENMKDHGLLIVYLELLKDLIEKKTNPEVQTTGIWYILNVAFPLYQQWSYENVSQIMTISKLCCSIFIQVLQQNLDNKQKDLEETFKMCLNYFLHEEILMSSYLSIFLKDKFFIQNLMEQESDWLNGPLLENIECIRLHFVLLLLLFKHKSNNPGIKCTLDDKIGIISRAVSGYMVNPYSLALRILSCKFLEVVAKDESVPLMALLGLDYDQTQRLFLERLRDPTEDNGLKLHILNLIGTCIFTQHGMTAAFFNVTRPHKWYGANKEKTIEGDTVNDFMVDYLQNIKKSHEYLRSPLQFGILQVMANLWITGKRHLVNDVIKLESFWPLLAEPLFSEYNQSPKVYANILKIFSIQLSDAENESSFLSTVEKFVTGENQLILWQQYLLNIFKTENIQEEHLEERLFLLKSWTEFLIMLEKKKDLRKFTPSIKRKFIDMGLIGVECKVVNTYCLHSWMNLLLIQVSTWNMSDTANNPETSQKIVNMLSVIKLHYNNLNTIARSTILVTIQIILKNLKTHYEENPLNLIEFLEQIGPLHDFEYNVLMEQIWETINDNQMLPWVICINIANDVLRFKDVGETALWFSYRNYLQKTITTTCELLKHPQMAPLTKLSLRSLILYLDTPMAFDFLTVNLTKFYNIIEVTLSSTLLAHSDKMNPLKLDEGWDKATLLMQFNTKFINTFQFTALPTCYSFITLHEKILHHIFKIPESTMALRALDLLINTLIFFNSMLVNWQQEWYRKSNSTYNFVMKSVKRVINSSLYTILRPKNIIVYSLDDYNRLTCMEKVPIELMVGIMNKLITVAGLGFSILYRLNPNLLDLLNVFCPDTVTILIKDDFTVPKFQLPVPYNLSYGTLLCLVHFFCKTLDALSHEKTAPPPEDLKKYYTGCFALVEHQGHSSNLHNQKLSSFLRYAMYEYSGLADPWIQKLDKRCVKNALESLMTFLSQQIFLAVNAEHSQFFKRNLDSELQFFYEYVKKYTSVLLSQSAGASQGSYKGEMDVLKRYLLHCKEKGSVEDIAEKNFFVFISHWLTNICQLT